MSFSVQVARAFGAALEWSGSNLNTVFAQRGNLLRRASGHAARPAALQPLATRIAEAGTEAALQQPLRRLPGRHRFGDAFRDWYFLPMMGCIWSCPTDQMLRFPGRPR
jgi:predicted NAD/FAD-binding protein